MEQVLPSDAAKISYITDNFSNGELIQTE